LDFIINNKISLNEEINLEFYNDFLDKLIIINIDRLQFLDTISMLFKNVKHIRGFKSNTHDYLLTSEVQMDGYLELICEQVLILVN
jgi:hypothetical protein